LWKIEMKNAEYDLLRRKALYFVRSLPTIRRKVSPPSSRSKSKVSKKKSAITRWQAERTARRRPGLILARKKV
jgi:hypothetical protein